MRSCNLFIFLLISTVSGFPSSRDYDYHTFKKRSDPLKIVRKWIEMKRLEMVLPQDGELFEGDMVMNPALRRGILGGLHKRSALIDNDNKWENGVVPYELDLSLSTKVLASLKKAFSEFKKYTCVRFVPREMQDDYILFKSEPHKCSSNVGKVRGRQVISLGPGCFRLGTVLHEMMHTLGVVHEQSRPDRDSHVKVLTENIEEKYIHNFRKYNFNDITDLNVPYNFASIMHYRNTAFSSNGKPTLRSIHFPDMKFGQRKMFSQGDIDQINRLYSCTSKQIKPTGRQQAAPAIRTENDGSIIPNTFDKLDIEKGNERGIYDF